MKYLRDVIMSGTALSVLACSGAAFAQGASPAAPTGDTAKADAGVADIIVTAQRRSENLQNVPIAVSAVTGDMLERRGVRTTEELASAVPSMTVFATAGFVQPRVRGIGNNVFGAGYENGVSTYIDGVYIVSAPASLFSLSNVERVEVLKGPQGTLFGRNATGGLIHVVTREPRADFGGSASVTGGDYDTYAVDGYVTGGLFDGLAADFAGHYLSQGKGYGVNLVNGRDVNRTDEDLNLRASQLLTPPGSSTKIRFTEDYVQTIGSNATATRLAPGTGAPFPAINPGSKPWNIALDNQPLNKLTSSGVSIRLDQGLGFANFAGISAYRQSRYHVMLDGDVTSTPGVVVDVHTRDQQFSQELQLTSLDTSKLKWVVGLYYLKSDSKYEPTEAQLFGGLRPVTPFGAIAAADTFSTLPTKSLAGYAQATAPIFDDNTNLTLGARYTTETHGISARATNILATGAVLPGAPIPDQSKDFKSPTWRVALDHRFSPQFMTYVSYNTGFKSGGYNGQFPTDAAFLPEKLEAYEVGVKSDLFDRRLRVNASAFHYDYTNIQVARFIGNQISYYNGAAATVYGVDADITARITSNFTLSGGFVVLHDRFDNFPNAVISKQIPTGIIVSTGSAKDNRLPLTPDFSATITADYTKSLGFAELGLDASYNYNDGYFTQPDNILRQASYNMISSGAELTFPNQMSVRVWGRNLGNAKVATTLAAGSIDSNVAYQAPRTYGITIGKRF
jgi:outer membrane receptor protein involved in Fe transport